ncbi:pyocin knob domain-containing protein [Chryseobacterium camelliae]|uniref:Pyocin knob domain-containing protein n=1 Tax=Chryseobacterium camelliae TaxID=1265445 RepID=A0ABY7QJI6_9FLAO|nr:pyocin knob domain-containing protein [Chryseobacterium camelliae]WBV59458.1 pyocin knob domain-containing protein [Chryseobacterium camelliae]
MSDIGKIIRVNALPPPDKRENNVIYQVAAPGAATYKDYAIDANGDLKTPCYVPLTGTVEGKPLTKNIEVDTSKEGAVGFISNTPDLSKAVLAIQEGGSVLAESRRDTDNTSSSIHLHHDTGIEITATASDSQFSAIIDTSGLQGDGYIPPTSDEHYVQRKYITDNFTSQTALNNTLADYYTSAQTDNLFYDKTEVDAKLSAVYRPKGSVADFASLPSSGNTEGDVWNIIDTGSNYVWVIDLNNTGVPGWDKLSETVDLTNYMTLNTEQIADGRKIFRGANGSRYDESAIEVRGNSSTIYPSIGFHQPGNYAGTISLRNSNQFSFRNTDDSDYNFLLAKGYIKSGFDDNSLLLAGGGHKAISDFVLSSQLENYHNIDLTDSINNGSDTRINKSWFDYNWAGTGHAGSVINFSGHPAKDYSTELFANYINDNIIGVRTRNGDTETWNPVRYLWHSGNLNPFPLRSSQAGTDANNEILSGLRSDYIWTNTPVSTIGTLLVENYSDDWIAQTFTILGNGIAGDVYKRIRHSGTTWTAWTKVLSSVDASNYVPVVGDTDIHSIKRFVGSYTQWALDGDIVNNARGFVQSLPGGFLVGTLNDKNFIIYRDAKEKIVVEDAKTTFNHSIESVGYVSSGDVALGDKPNILRINRQSANDLGILSESNGWAYVNAAGYKRSGSDDNYVLTGGGGHKALNDFLANKGRIFQSNVDANNIGDQGSAIISIETGNGSGNTNFPNNSTYGTFMKMSANSFTSEFFHQNGGELWHRNWYLSDNPSSYPFRKIWDNVNLPNPVVPSDITNVFRNNSIHSNEIGVVATTLDAEIPNGGYISSYYGSDWGGTDRPNGASYGGYIKFKGNFNGDNNLDFYYNNGHAGVPPRLWYRTKEGVNGVRDWMEFWTTQNFNPDNYVTRSTNQIIDGSKTFSPSSIVDFKGNDQNNVIVYKTSAGVEGLVSGHEYTHYSTRWRVGNKRGNGTNSLGYSFEFSYDNGVTYTEKARIDEAGFFTGNAFVSPVLNGNQVFNANNLNQLFFGNPSVGTVYHQAGSLHAFSAGGNYPLYISSGGIAVNGALSINGQDVATQSWSTSSFIPSSQKGAANGIATLDTNGLIPTTQLPSYVDDVLEFTNLTSFPNTGESGKIYVALDTNKTYRWSGSSYIYITSGAVDSVNGQTGVVNLSKTDIGLSNADNTSDAAKNVLSATKWTAPRTLSYSGDVTGSASVDGSGNVGFAMTLANSGVSAGTYNSVNVDAKGRVLSGNNVNYVTESYLTTFLQQNYFNQTASDERFVNANGDEAINGNKTFTSSPAIPAATNGDHAVNLEQLTASLSNVVRDNDDFEILEVYRLIDSSHFDLDDTRVKKYNIVFEGASNGSVNITYLKDNQYYQFSNVSGSGADLRINVEGYGAVDVVSPGKTTVYMSWGSGKLLKISENDHVSII